MFQPLTCKRILKLTFFSPWRPRLLLINKRILPHTLARFTPRFTPNVLTQFQGKKYVGNTWRITDFKNTLKFHFHTQKLELLCTALKKKKKEKKKTSTAQWLSFEWPHFIYRGRTEVKVSLHAIDQGG